MSIATDAKGLLKGVPFGEVWPPYPPRPLPDMDARTHALRRLRQFIAALDFSRTGNVNEPAIGYRVPKEQIHTEQPDEPQNLTMPAIAFLPGESTTDAFGLGPAKMEEDTADVFGEGLVLVVKHDYVEPFILEVWGASKAERRSLVAGLTEAFTSLEESGTLRLTLPDYFDRVAEFTFLGTKYIDDPEVIRGRRRAHLRVELRVPEVQLVPYKEIRPELVVETVDGGFEALIELAEAEAERTKPIT